MKYRRENKKKKYRTILDVTVTLKIYKKEKLCHQESAAHFVQRIFFTEGERGQK